MSIDPIIEQLRDYDSNAQAHIRELSGQVADLSAQLGTAEFERDVVQQAFDDHMATHTPRLPHVQPLSAEWVRQRWYVCDHPSWGGTYGQRESVGALVADMGYPGIRGLLATDSRTGQDRVLRTARFVNAIGGKWCASIRPTSAPEADIAATIRWLAETPEVARSLGWLEGPNEWNASPLWDAARCVAEHRIMRDELAKHPSLAHVKIAGASLHDQRLKATGGKECRDVMAVDGGVYASLIDVQSLHSYPGGADIDSQLARRTGYWADAGLAGVPFAVTETGWKQAGGQGGGATVTEEQAAALASRAPFLAAKAYTTHNVIWFARYELLVTPQGGDLWGPVDCMSPTVVADPLQGRRKPEYGVTKSVMDRLRDPGGAGFTPAKVGLEVIGNGVSWLAVGKRDGSVDLALWTTDDKATAPVPATVRTGSGTSLVEVKPLVTWVPVRRAGA